MFFFLHFMHVDPSKSCTLGLWTCTNRGQTRSERSVSIPFSALCLTNDVHVNVKPTVCGRFVNRTFHLRFERPAESSGNISRCRPLLVRRRSSSSSETPIVELSCARGPAPPQPPPTHLRFQHPHPQNAARRTSSRFVSRIASSSCAGCQHQEVLLRPRCSVSPSHSYSTSLLIDTLW